MKTQTLKTRGRLWQHVGNGSTAAIAVHAISVYLCFPVPAGTGETRESLQRPDLIGRVLDQKSMPIPEATVFIFTAGPRVGTSPFCPSCYPDCRKSATTDQQGNFKIESLDPQLRFRILVVLNDYKPTFVSKVDPLKGPAEISLDKLNRGNLGPKNQLRGRVVDTEGKPVFGATINFEFYSGDQANCGGQCEGVDLVSVADRKGDFLITTQLRFDWMTVSVEARGFAKRKFFKLASGQSHELKLTEGASVAGKVVMKGQPLKSVMVGLVSVDRSDNFTGDFTVGTNDEGRFLFVNIPPYQTYYVYGIMDSLREYGAIPIKKIRVSADGSAKNAGELTVAPAHRLAGRVVLDDGTPIPPKTRLLVGREDAWDTASVELDEHGRFDLRGIPPESVGISVRVPGYRFSDKNKSLDRLNGGSLLGRIDRDIVDLQLLLEPGQFVPPDFKARRGVPEDWQPRGKPLHGAESTNL